MLLKCLGRANYVGASECHMGRGQGWVHQENTYGLSFETPIPINPTKGAPDIKNLLCFTLSR